MRLLLVEDDTLLGESMQVALSRQGYTVDWLERGGGVVTALKTEQFTALILTSPCQIWMAWKSCAKFGERVTHCLS